jgi:hypothetical protein
MDRALTGGLSMAMTATPSGPTSISVLPFAMDPSFRFPALPWISSSLLPRSSAHRAAGCVRLIGGRTGRDFNGAGRHQHSARQLFGLRRQRQDDGVGRFAGGGG